MRFRTLGPLRVWTGRSWSTVAAPRQRLLLAVLLADAGRLVSIERLVDELWGATPPRRAVSTVQVYVGRLRRFLAGGGSPEVLVTRGRGYELAIGAGELDAGVFEHLVVSGRRHLAEDRLKAAEADLSEGLRLWSGPALADVPEAPSVTVEAARLEERRLGALEDKLDVQLRLGRPAEAAEELKRLVVEQPFRERLWATFMVALYRCGRRAEALTAYQHARRLLADELGLEPGPQLRALHERLLADDPRLTAPAGDTPEPSGPGPAVRPISVPAQLPPGVADFSGRAYHLKQLDRLLAGFKDQHSLPVIGVVSGAAGVGKTALVVHWARRVRQCFPDGQMYVNLRGWTAGSPMCPVAALALILPALGIPKDEIPDRLEPAAALYRSLLADRRALVVLDNARDSEQVRPLLPGGSGCLVLVTSRDRLGGLVALHGAVRLDLDVLPSHEAEVLLARLLGPDRAEADPQAAAEMAELCGHVPMALRIAAANLTNHPNLSIAEYVSKLRDGDRLAALKVTGDPSIGVQVAYDHSYAALPAEAQRLFRLLGLIPGSDITVEAAAALADVTPAQASALLDRLVCAHLLDEPTEGHYGLPGLLRLYAEKRTHADDNPAARLAAWDRLFDYQMHCINAAASHRDDAAAVGDAIMRAAPRSAGSSPTTVPAASPARTLGR